MGWDNKGKCMVQITIGTKTIPYFGNSCMNRYPCTLYFAGGESQLSKNTIHYWKKLLNVDMHPKLNCVTIPNGLEMPQRLFDIWSHFKRVRFHYSVDSIHEMNDYIRFSKWDPQLNSSPFVR